MSDVWVSYKKPDQSDLQEGQKEPIGVLRTILFKGQEWGMCR